MGGPTSDNQEIQSWAHARNALPAEVLPRKFDGEPAVLRFVFEHLPLQADTFEQITWENFFALFDLMGLSLVYNGENSYELLQIEAKSVYRFEGKPI